MKTKSWLPIAVAVVLGGIAAVLARRSVAPAEATPSATATVMVATRAIAPGAAIAAGDVEPRTIAAALLPAGAFANGSSPVGRTVQAELVQGQPVLESMLAPPGSASGLQALVPPGMRAMTIEVNEFSSVGGMVTPGSRVDIISTMQDAHHRESMSRTIAQNVLVKAVGQETGQVDEKGAERKVARSVTLLVTSKQAEAIQLATIAGRPWLVLRGSEDEAVAPLAGTTLAELRGAAPGAFRDLFAAWRNNRSPEARPIAAASAPPATQPVASRESVPNRSVHVIRNTVESTVSVAPTFAAPLPSQRQALSGATIEP